MTQARAAAKVLMRTPIYDDAEWGDACLGGEVVERRGALVERDEGVVEAEGFSIAADGEEGSGEDGATDDGAGDGAERVFGF